MSMILTDYYCFEKLSEKSKMRMDCVASTMSYPEFEDKRATKATKATEKRDETKVGNLIIYYGNVPDGFSADVKRKADKHITIKSNNLTSVYVPDVRNENLAFGDVKGTSDALLLVFKDFSVRDRAVNVGGLLEIFVARGKSENSLNLYNLLADGELDDEIEELRRLAKPER